MAKMAHKTPNVWAFLGSVAIGGLTCGLADIALPAAALASLTPAMASLASGTVLVTFGIVDLGGALAMDAVTSSTYDFTMGVNYDSDGNLISVEVQDQSGSELNTWTTDNGDGTVTVHAIDGNGTEQQFTISKKKASK